MNDLLRSPLFEDIKNGKLPTIEISVSSESLAFLGIAVFLAIVAALIAHKIISQL